MPAPTSTGSRLPDHPSSLWIEETPRTGYDPLKDDATVDVAIVGGGITGLTAARNLLDEDRSVAVLEAQRIVEGVTGHTTAKLTSQHGLIYAHLMDAFGPQAADQYARANQAAIEAVEERVSEFSIDCGLHRAPAITYVEDPDRVDEVQDEVQAAKKLNLPASFTDDPGLPYEVPGAVRFDDQAHFHPRRYLLGIAESIADDGGHIWERTRATNVEDGDPCTVDTGGGTVTADDVIVATHFPVFDRGMYFARMHPKKSYVLAARLDEAQPEGMYYRDAEAIFSVRPKAGVDQDLVLFTGENHRPGVGDSKERYRTLESTVQGHYPVDSIDHRWSTQDFVPSDGVPFVGPLAPQTDHLYVATGFGGWGMTNGVAAGRMLAETLAREAPETMDVFDPSRVKLATSFSELAKHNLSAAKYMANYQLRRLTGPRTIDLAPGEGGVFYQGKDAVAAYRDEEGTLHTMDATCRHMGCQVSWNGGDETWDCPCHGSRYDAEGHVLDGPAKEDLAPVDGIEDEGSVETSQRA